MNWTGSGLLTKELELDASITSSTQYIVSHTGNRVKVRVYDVCQGASWSAAAGDSAPWVHFDSEESVSVGCFPDQARPRLLDYTQFTSAAST